MAATWIEEGLTQLEFFEAWRHYFANLGTIPETGVWRHAREASVLEPFQAAVWMPGLDRVFNRISRELIEGAAQNAVTLGTCFKRNLATHATQGIDRIASDISDDAAALIKAYTSAVYEYCARKTDEPPAARFPGEGLIYPSLGQHVTFWLNQTRALLSWADHETNELRPLLDARKSPWLRLGERCREVQAQLSQKAQATESKGLLRSLASNSTEGNLYLSAAALLGDCKSVFDRMQKESISSGGMGHESLLKGSNTIAHLLREKRKLGWPPALLVDLRNHLKDLDFGLVDFLERIEPRTETWDSWAEELQVFLPKRTLLLRARVALARAVVEGLAEQNPPRAAWDIVKLSLARLVPPGIMLCADSHATDPNSWIQEREDPNVSGRVLSRLGIIVRDEGPDRVILPLEVHVPPHRTQLADDFERLAIWLFRRPGTDDLLAKHSREMACEFAQISALDWWNQSNGEKRSTLWRTIQHAVLLPDFVKDAEPLIAGLLVALEQEGFYLNGRVDSQHVIDLGPWFIAPMPGLAVGPEDKVRQEGPCLRVSTGGKDKSTILLRGPDGMQFGPAVWLRLPRKKILGSPLCRCLHDLEADLSQLYLESDRAWQDWPLLCHLARQCECGTEKVHDVRRAFIALHTRWQESKEGLRNVYLRLAQRFHACLVGEMEAILRPPLRSDGLTPEPLSGPPSYDALISYTRSSAPLGTVLKILEFGDETTPARLEVSLGQRPGPEKQLDDWLALSIVPVFGRGPGQVVLNSPPLEAWRKQLDVLVWHPERFVPYAAEARANFVSWSRSRGADWFHALADQAIRGEEGLLTAACRSWLKILLRQKWCLVFPAWDLDRGTLSWPVSNAEAGQGVLWEFADSPAGSVIAVQRFASDPVSAQVTLSQGTRLPGSALDFAHGLQETIESADWLSGSLRRPVKELVSTTREDPNLTKPTDQIVLILLDGIIECIRQRHKDDAAASNFRELPLKEVEVLDKALGQVRGWCRLRDQEILPRNWEFGRISCYAELHEDEKTCRFAWGPTDTQGLIYRIDAFGLVSLGNPVRQCQGMVSVGPAPDGFKDLESLLKQSESARKILERLRVWRDAKHLNTLEMAAVQLYVDFWAGLGDELREQQAEMAEDFIHKYEALLLHEFGLNSFSPASFTQYPEGWVKQASANVMRTGRVLRVCQPGLQDVRGLRVPALVEVE